ncbi:FAD:protein FMN transferase [Clostridium tertium]|jgi:FAD:protein FMN transferase|uniref:FAD:protein FMN transferase n=1 Tax=Clostridium TaxID=1485 RepID=UPI00115B73B9|nr:MULTISPECIES: FAD:protein FMN transferase [Clostridium]MBP1870026.1 thiamine biosynthesis lipoprotein [Clostridium tertium]MBS5308353.1 FAD:protein FMN transferase [Clostridium sp.]MDB1923758.1 FAD:protein FMN transferase [Clostridium tertium]MDB1926779.1 FAD:protein FMN transferase [Clostridium tertium]MDB1930407.1 FAD:protein FMN transferase [Clostridium tertium]
MKKKYLNYFTISILLIFSLTILSGCSKDNKVTEPLSKTELLMGTVVTVTLYDSNDEGILDKVFTKVKELESTLSINENGTLVDKINESAGIEPVKVDYDTYTVIKKGLEYAKLSNGLFDISVGPIVKLWNIGLPEAKVPTQEEIDSRIPLVGYSDVELNDEENTVFLKRQGMMIDLGGVAKGYTADVISDILTEEGVKSAIIDLGGNIFAHGLKVDGSTWRIGIQNPFSDRGDIIGTITVKNKSIVTSGIYERYIEKDGIKYHHILSPKTGYPYENEIAGITIISDKSSDGDALSTSVFAMGVEEGMKFVNTQEGIDAIFVTKDNKIYITDGIRDIFKLTNTDFTLSN